MNAAEGVQIVTRSTFRLSAYPNDCWLSTRLRWRENDLMLLSAACDLAISYTDAANTLGRAPTTLVWKARDQNIKVPAEWNKLVYKYKQRKWQQKIDLQYPYIVKPDERHDELLAVHRMIGRELPGREDVCQDIMLALWQSKTSLAELRADPSALKAFVRSFRKASFERSGYGVESIDATISGTDDLPKYESIGLEDALLWMRTKVQ